MSDSLRDLLDEAEDRLGRAAEDVEREVRGVVNDVDDDRGTPSTTSPAAQVTRLYDTVFDRAPDDAGLTFWPNAVRAGAGLDDVAELFVA